MGALDGRVAIVTRGERERPDPVGGGPHTRADNYRLVLLAMCVSVIVVVGGMTSLNLALPDVGRHLVADQSQLQWMVDGYALVLAALVLPCGALGDRFGRKWMLLGGMAILLGALVWAAEAHSAPNLIAARAVAGVGAALVFPGTLATITAVYPPERRGQAVGLWSACAILGGLVGLLASGALITLFWWGSIFVATAIAVVVSFMLTAVVVPNTSDPEHAHLDPGGSLLSVVAVGGLVLGITEGPLRGWGDPLTLAAGACGLVALAGFVAWELRMARPLLDVRLFAHRAFAAGALSIFVQMFCVFGVMFLSVQYLAYILGYRPLDSGVAILAVGVLMLPAAVIADPLARRFGRNRIGAVGLATMVPGLVILAVMSAGSGYWHLALGLAVFGGGLGLAVVPATEAIVEALPAAKQGVASAVNDVAREFGAALGIAAVGSAFNGAYRGRVAGGQDLPAEFVDVVRDSPAAGLRVAANLGEGAGPVISLVHDAFMHGWAVAMIVAAGVAGIGAVVVAVRTPKLGGKILDASHPVHAPDAAIPTA